MAITVANRLQNLSDSDATSYTTASTTPASGNAWVLYVSSARTGSAPPSLTVTGNSLTWASLGAIDYATDAGGGTHRRIEMFSGVGTPSAGTILIDAGAVTLICAAWMLNEITGGNLSVPVVPGSVVTGFSDTAGTTGTVTFNAAADSNNRPIACFSHGTGESVTVRTNWTRIGSDQLNAAPAQGTGTQYRSDTFETTGSATWTTSSKWGAIGGELAIVAAASTQQSTLGLLHVG